jgi:hypothetical protein
MQHANKSFMGVQPAWSEPFDHVQTHSLGNTYADQLTQLSTKAIPKQASKCTPKV